MRAEILGTLTSVVFLLTLTIMLVFFAVGRVVNPQEVKGVEMAITAVMGLFFNLIQMKILHQDGHDGHDHDHEGGRVEYDGGDKAEVKQVGVEGCEECEASNEVATNINVDAAFLHALGDMIMSIGVCIAATIIYFWPEATIADPICTFVFSVIVCATTRLIVKNCINVLMQGAPLPKKCDQVKLAARIRKLEPGLIIDDFKLW